MSEALDALARESGFSGVVSVDRAGELVVASAYGYAHRAWGIPNEPGTRFGIASGTKGLTALAVMSLVESGALRLETTARSLLGDDLPLVAADVTVEHLLAHRSGIGDYLDEDVDDLDVDDYVLSVPVHTLDSTEAYLHALEGHATKFPAGELFSYSNSGYVLLALLAERASGVPFHELVVQRVCEPAGMADTAFLRSDELPGGTALGYTGPGDRTNVLHLPVRGSGDGGIYTTVADVRSLWTAFFAGRIVSHDWACEMVRPRSDAEGARRYGLGFWLHGTTDVVLLEGMDAGVSFRSAHDPNEDLTWTVVSNTTYGAWSVARWLAEHVGELS